MHVVLVQRICTYTDRTIHISISAVTASGISTSGLELSHLPYRRKDAIFLADTA